MKQHELSSALGSGAEEHELYDDNDDDENKPNEEDQDILDKISILQIISEKCNDKLYVIIHMLLCHVIIYVF